MEYRVLALIKSLFTKKHTKVYFDSLHSFIVVGNMVYYRKRFRLVHSREYAFEIGLRAMISYTLSYPGNTDRIEVISLKSNRVVGIYLYDFNSCLWVYNDV